MKRLIENKLLKLLNNYQLPIVIEGSALVGKTYFIQEFANKHYKENYIYIDLKKFKNKQLQSSVSPDEIIEILKMRFSFLNQDTLIIFDNQDIFMNNIFKSLKLFVEQNLNYKIIFICRTELNLKNDPNYFHPLKIYTLHFFPLSFQEYLINRSNYNNEKYIIDSLKTLKPLEQDIHNKLISFFNEYLFVGGYPLALKNFLNHLIETSKVINDIKFIDLTIKNDIEKLTNSKIKNKRMLVVYEQIYQNLLQVKFKLTSISKNARLRDYEDDILLLDKLNTINKINNFDFQEKFIADNKNFKLFYNDHSLSRIKLIDDDLNINNNNEYSILINCLYNQLKYCNQEINFYYSYYWKSGKIYEIDIILIKSDSFIPCEIVLKDKDINRAIYRLSKIENNNIKIIFSKENLKYLKEENILILPFYCICYLDILLNEHS